MSNEPDRLVPVARLADRWNVAPLTVRRWIAEGRIQALRVGRLWRVRNSEVERFEREASEPKPA
jgi:excisionase family DNA binding protein